MEVLTFLTHFTTSHQIPSIVFLKIYSKTNLKNFYFNSVLFLLELFEDSKEFLNQV